MDQRDWYAWHDRYDEPGSPLAGRLAAVRERIRVALDEAPTGPVRVLSLVAGQGRDLIPVVAEHPRRPDIVARLVEADPRNARVALAALVDRGLSQVEVRVGDAALVDNYTDLAPADVVLLCGLFGNISDADIAHTIRHAATLTRRGGTVVWTRHRREPDLFPRIGHWFAESGFQPVWSSAPGLAYGVGAHRAERDPATPVAGTRMFTFVV